MSGLPESPTAGARGAGWLDTNTLMFLGFIALVLVVAGWLYVVPNVGGLIAHQAWPGLGFTAAIKGLGPLHHPSNPALSYPGPLQARLPGPVMYWTVGAAVLALPAVAAQMGWHRLALRMHARRRGLASRSRIRLEMGASAIAARGSSLRPTLAQTRPPTAADVAVPLGRSIPFNINCFVCCEESMVVVAPPRSGKTTQIVEPLAFAWAGPRLLTSSRPELLQATWLGLTAADRPLWVLDHSDLSGWGRRSGWSLVSGCADVGTAQQRARVLVQASGAGADTKDASTWQNGAAELLSCWLVAAAVAGRGAGEVLRWANNQADPTPVNVLRSGGYEILAAALTKYATMDPEPRSSFFSLASQPLTALQRPEILAFFDPAPEDAFDIATWLNSTGTVMLFSDETDGSALTGPLAAFVDSVVEEAKRGARRSRGGRLDPGLLLDLDELMNICPLPQIPALVSQSGGQGIFVVVVLQNFAQAERRYGLVGLRMLFASCTVRILLGGEADTDDLERWSKLFGEYDQTTVSVQQGNGSYSMSGHVRRQPIYDVAALRQLEPRQALVSMRGLAPVMLHQDRTYDPKSPHHKTRERSIEQYSTMATQTWSAPAGPAVPYPAPAEVPSQGRW